MPRWILKRLNRVYDVADDGTTGAGADGGNVEDKSTDTPDTSKDDAGKKEGNQSIPKARFDEINEKYKAAKAELDKINADKAKAEEQEAIKRGEHEKVIAEKDKELEQYRAKEEMWKARETEQTTKNQARIDALKADYGEKWGTVANLIKEWDDPFATATTLDAIEAMKPTKAGDKEPDKKDFKGGKGTPESWNQGRLAELKAKAERGERLSDRERKELYDLIEGK